MVSFDVLAPLVFAAGIILCASGASTLRRADPVRRALHAAGLPDGPWGVRALAGVEIVAGASVLIWPGPGAFFAVAALYLGFAAFLASMLLRGVDASCGCAGRRDLPPSWLHAALTVIVALAAIGFAAVRPDPPGLVGFVARSPALGLALAAGSALIAWLGVQVVLLVPAAFDSYRGRARA